MKLLGHEINPNCGMQELEDQFMTHGIRDDSVSGNPFCSFARYKHDGFETIHVRGKKDGSSVWELEEHYHYKYTGLVVKSIWRKHWWTRFDR